MPKAKRRRKKAQSQAQPQARVGGGPGTPMSVAATPSGSPALSRKKGSAAAVRRPGSVASPPPTGKKGPSVRVDAADEDEEEDDGDDNGVAAAPAPPPHPADALRPQLADLHLMLRAPKGLELFRAHLVDRHGIGQLAHALDAWAAIQVPYLSISPLLSRPLFRPIRGNYTRSVPPLDIDTVRLLVPA